MFSIYHKPSRYRISKSELTGEAAFLFQIVMDSKEI